MAFLLLYISVYIFSFITYYYPTFTPRSGKTCRKSGTLGDLLYLNMYKANF